VRRPDRVAHRGHRAGRAGGPAARRIAPTRRRRPGQGGAGPDRTDRPGAQARRPRGAAGRHRLGEVGPPSRAGGGRVSRSGSDPMGRRGSLGAARGFDRARGVSRPGDLVHAGAILEDPRPRRARGAVGRNDRRPESDRRLADSPAAAARTEAEDRIPRSLAQ
jgi:hypothetical protein